MCRAAMTVKVKPEFMYVDKLWVSARSNLLINRAASRGLFVGTIFHLLSYRFRCFFVEPT